MEHLSHVLALKVWCGLSGPQHPRCTHHTTELPTTTQGAMGGGPHREACLHPVWTQSAVTGLLPCPISWQVSIQVQVNQYAMPVSSTLWSPSFLEDQALMTGWVIVTQAYVMSLYRSKSSVRCLFVCTRSDTIGDKTTCICGTWKSFYMQIVKWCAIQTKGLILTCFLHKYFINHKGVYVQFSFIQTCANGHIIWRWNSQPTLKWGTLCWLATFSCQLFRQQLLQNIPLFKFMNMGMVAAKSFHNIQDVLSGQH